MAEGIQRRSWRADLQSVRLAQLHGMAQDDLHELRNEMLRPQRLPRLELHFRRHGHEFGADTVDVYEQQFLAHIQKSDLQIFTFLRRADNTRMCYFIDEVSSSIAVYNQTRKRYSAFFHLSNVRAFLDHMKSYWVEVTFTRGEWRIQAW